METCPNALVYRTRAAGVQRSPAKTRRPNIKPMMLKASGNGEEQPDKHERREAAAVSRRTAGTSQAGNDMAALSLTGS